MNRPPAYSIIIPALNEEKFLPRLLTDLIHQSFSDFEVILVDGHSNDHTVKKAQQFSSKLNVAIVNSKKRNVAHQRNLGARRARAPWLIFFDADNRLPHQFLSQLDRQLQKKSPDAFSTFILPDSDNPQDKAIAAVANLGSLASAFIKKPTAFGACIGIKTQIFNQTQGFDPNIIYQEDREFVQRLVDQGHRFFIFAEPQIIFSFRRFRKEGTLNLIRRSAQLHLENTFAGFTSLKDTSQYPMLGGTYYQPGSKKKSLDFKQINNYLERLTKRELKKLDHFLKSLTSQ